MTNEEKFKMPEERYDEFYKYCKSKSCYDCPILPSGYTSRMNGNAYCALKWLALEAEEEEKPLPCPFCGADGRITELKEGGFRAFCWECLSTSGAYKTKADAIAAWNRRGK